MHNNIKPLNRLPDNQSVIGWYRLLKNALLKTNQRQLVLCQGSREWCRLMIPGPGVFNNQIVLSNESDLEQSIAFKKTDTLLGLEADCVVFDGFSGLNIDVLCQAAGLIRAGGVLVIISPEQPGQIDDEFGVWQNRKNEQYYFIEYLFQQFNHHPGVVKLQESCLFPEIRLPEVSPKTPVHNRRTTEQKTVIEDLQRWLVDQSAPLFFLTADRGRGKSTTLGLLLRQLNRSIEVVITAASRAQATVLLDQLERGQINTQFLSPDEFIRQQSRIPCLVIDEAAMLPANILHQCIALADKTILATTTGGYEGTGQGFLLKFLASFERTQYQHEKLYQPVRWGQSDQLEQLINSALMFDPLEPIKKSSSAEISIETLDKKYLSENQNDLREIYGLLISAHYRTRPSDLRQLMEDPNQSVIVARSGNDIVAVLLLNEEGGFDDELSEQVFLGKRRPQGHLFAQMITAQAGVKSFCAYRGLRVQRITVNPDYRRQGIGHRLIEEAEQLVKDRGMDYLSSSFALDSALAPFWRSQDFQLVHISSGKGKSTGRQTIAVIKTISTDVQKPVQALRLKIQSYLPVWLLSLCKTMIWQDVLCLIELHAQGYDLTAQDNDELEAFSAGHKGLDLTLGPLQKLLISQLPETSWVADSQKQLLVERVLLNRSSECVSDTSEFKGRKEQLKQIRNCIFKLYEHYQSSGNK